jgi:hypothetical protein
MSTINSNCPIYRALMSVKADVAAMVKRSIVARYETYSAETAMPEFPGHWGSSKAFDAAYTSRHCYDSRALSNRREDVSQIGALCNPGYVEQWVTSVSDPTFRYATKIYCFGLMNEEKVAAHCEAVATATCLMWYGKMIAKLGPVEACTIVAHPMNGGEYTLEVIVKGVTVTIRQIVTHNYRSDSGKSYFQFPARIYLAGKFVTEAAYKKWVAAAV